MSNDTETSLRFDKLERLEKGVFSKKVEPLSRELINTDFLCSDHRADTPFKEGLAYFLSDSNLWKTLTPAVGRCDAMVEGKYHRARAFAFETTSLYLYCESETEHRGTSWQVAKKEASPPTKGMMKYWKAEDGLERAEVIDFFERLLLTFATLSADMAQQLRQWAPAVEAWAQAREIEIETSPTIIPFQGRKPSL